MIEGIIKSEEELRKLLRKDLKEAGRQCAPTKKELDEQIEDFMNDEDFQPKEYPIYIYVDFTFVYHGFDVELLSTSHTLTKAEMQKLLNEF
jgi:hypothetical protein